MKVVNISDISTQATNVEYETFSTIPFLPALDHVEYSMGLERGEIMDFETRPSATIQMPKDMIPLYSEGRWALLPTMDTMASMCDLFSANSKCATKDRIHFTTVCSPYVLKWPLNNPRSHSPKRSIHFNSCPLSRKATSLYLSTVNGVAHTFPFTHSPLVKTTLHPCFVWKRCEDYLIDGHNDACPTTGLTELDRGNITVGTAVELKRAINILWFQATTREVSSPRSYAETRPDPTGIPESEGEKAIRWFQDNILPSADGPFNEDIGETDMRVLKKMHVWHSTVMPPSKNGDGEMTSDQARASLLEENLLTDEEDCHDNASTSALIKSLQNAPGRHHTLRHPIISPAQEPLLVINDHLPVGSPSILRNAVTKRKRVHIEDREQIQPPAKPTRMASFDTDIL